MSGNSTTAMPPIRSDEEQFAPTAICRHHNGLIRETGDKEGAVFYCPIGHQYWRYTKQTGGMYAPIPYPRTKIV